MNNNEWRVEVDKLPTSAKIREFVPQVFLTQKPHTREEIRLEIQVNFHLTDEQMNLRRNYGTSTLTVISGRLHSILEKWEGVGYIERVRRSTYQITPLGKQEWGSQQEWGPQYNVSPIPSPLIRIQDYISHLQGALTRLNLVDVQRSIDAVMDAYRAEKQIFVIGNGGSASTASHLACDLGKGTSVAGKPRFRVISLTDNVATMTAWANDVAYEDIFVEQLKNLVNPGDLVIGISASGNSENVLRAMRHAADIGCETVGWCGFGGGELAELCDISVVVDSHRYGPVEDVHLVLNHVLHAWITEEFA